MAPKKSQDAFPTAAPFLPERLTLPSLQRAAAGCRGCDLWKNATQTVFGEGPSKALVMFVGEQPGDYEDRQGHPFVGPAGRLLDEVLAEVEIDRSEVYVTNVVKHFKWEAAQRGKRRIHKKPRQFGNRSVPSLAGCGVESCAAASSRLPWGQCGPGIARQGFPGDPGSRETDSVRARATRDGHGASIFHPACAGFSAA